MINRTLLRIKLMQATFALYESETDTMKQLGKEPTDVAPRQQTRLVQTAQNILGEGFKKTHELYCCLLSLIPEITRYAQEKIENGRNKFLPSEEELHPNTRFADNLLAAQLADNEALHKLRETLKLHIDWTEHADVIRNLYADITQQAFYADYMQSDDCGYDYDKMLWRKIVTNVFTNNEALADIIEEDNLYYASDVELVCSFIVKTIKHFDANAGQEQPLLPLFDDLKDEQMAMDQMKDIISRWSTYQQLIDQHTKNWDLERITLMDRLIMHCALAEICSVPTIPVSVTINEYVDIAKAYSSDKSGKFVNAVLDQTAQELIREKKIIKAVVLR
ncbi:MAG: transcription antitermination factor NusB [Paludibacteraceae bacterium]|nr:transcription antitermination factor NusB [Paludibacteraceae bacterium]